MLDDDRRLEQDERAVDQHRELAPGPGVSGQEFAVGRVLGPYLAGFVVHPGGVVPG